MEMCYKINDKNLNFLVKVHYVFKIIYIAMYIAMHELVIQVNK